jgi:hypothetical protein
MAVGVLTVNPDPAQASWLDMLRAEEVGNVGRVDIGKIQALFFTTILLTVYGAAVAALLEGHLDFRTFASTTGDRVICTLPGRVPPGLRILESYGRYNNHKIPRSINVNRLNRAKAAPVRLNSCPRGRSPKVEGHPDTKIEEFPALSGSMLALLGISDAAYPANKAVTRTPT